MKGNLIMIGFLTLGTMQAPSLDISRDGLSGGATCTVADTSRLKAGNVIDSISSQGYTLVWVDKASSIEPGEKDRLTSVFFKVYPREVAEFNPASTHRVVFVLDPAYDGIAETWDDTTRFNTGWFVIHRDDIDVVTHEVMHIVQSYSSDSCPGWVTEGIADYARYTFGQANALGDWALPDYTPDQKYTDAYRVTARFFLWMERHGHPGFVQRLDGTMRAGEYHSGLWKEWTGKSVDDLWADYAASPQL